MIKTSDPGQVNGEKNKRIYLEGLMGPLAVKRAKNLADYV